MPAKSVTPSHSAPETIKKVFTIDEANRSLVYVRRIMADLTATYQHAVSLQQQRDDLIVEEGEALRRDYDKTVHRLNDLTEELSQVGVDLRDYELGLVDFPARHDGRIIALSWQVGEEEIVAWHEIDQGFVDRQPLEGLDPVEAVEEEL